MRINRPATLVSEIARLRRRVTDAERANLHSGAVSRNHMTVFNDDGTPSVILGALPDGTRGVGVYDDAGSMVTLSNLAFGMKAARSAGVINWDQGAGGGVEEWFASGPSVTVDVQSGRMIVIVSGTVEAGGSLARAAFSHVLDGPTPVLQSFNRALSVTHNSGGVSVKNAGAFAHQHDGLLPGEYTVTGYYGFSSNAAPGGAFGSVSQRSLIVLPY